MVPFFLAFVQTFLSAYMPLPSLPPLAWQTPLHPSRPKMKFSPRGGFPCSPQAKKTLISSPGAPGQAGTATVLFITVDFIAIPPPGLRALVQGLFVFCLNLQHLA